MDGTLNTALVAMLCRTSDRSAETARGVRALAKELGERWGVDPRFIGSPGDPREASFVDDLRDSRGCLLEAGGQIDDALEAGRYPVLLAGHCSICITTLPVVLRHHPDAWVLWLDAHGDFNTPETTESGFLGGMCLAAACGLWDAGFGLPAVDPTRVVMCGVRDLDAGERVLLDTNGVARIERPSLLGETLGGRQVFVHLDCDVLDPSILPAAFPAEGGLSDGGLRLLLEEVVESCDVIGCEITAFQTPELAETVATVVDPLLERIAAS